MIQDMKKPHVVIIGGGITGLSAAWFLQQSGDVAYTVLEGSSCWGGKIKTETIESDAGSFVVEYGPDSFVTQKPAARKLAEALGMSDDLIGTNMEKRKIFLLNRDRMTPLPDGMMLIVPTRFAPFAFSRLISIPGKIRMAMEMFIPARPGDEDESIESFVGRRLGQEAVDKLAEPLLSGIFNTDPERQSLLTTFPRFRALEQKYGSLTRGILQARKHMPKKAGSPFMSLRGGMTDLIEELTGQLTGDLHLGADVVAVEPCSDGTYQIMMKNGEVVTADAVIMATPGQVTSQMLQDILPEGADIVRDIPHVTTGTVTLAYREEDLPYPLDGHGVVIPRKAGRDINAITWSSSKFAQRAPEGHALLRVFFGGSRSPQTVELNDEELLQTVRRELREIMRLDAEPLFSRIYRTHEAIPQYLVGHTTRMNELDEMLPDGLNLAGAAYRGAGVPDCIQSAETAVTRTLENLRVPTG